MKTTKPGPGDPLPSELIPLTTVLTHAFDALDGDDEFIIDIDDSTRYMQFASFGPNLRGETVGNRHLDDDPMDTDDLQWLGAHGWNEPDDAGNHWRHWEPADALSAATVTVVTLHRIHGVTDPRELTFSSDSPVALVLLEGFLSGRLTIGGLS